MAIEARDKMSSSDLFVAVPSFFKCPISMDVMTSPVSLSTGVTYDRSSIQTWLDSGHNTCPATMQVLPTNDVVPNLTLRRLIHLWSDSIHLRSPASGSSIAAIATLSKQQVLNSINSIESKSENFSNSLSIIADFAKYSNENRKFLSEMDNFLRIIFGIWSNVDKIEVSESIMSVLGLILSESRVKEQIHRLIFKSNRASLNQFVSVLQKGSASSKIETAKILAAIAIDAESQRAIAETQGLLYELHRLITFETDRTATEAGLSAIIAVSTSRPAKKELVRLGTVRTLAKILSGSNSNTVVPITEKALELLETLSTCTEGRAAIGGDESCVPAVVQRLMKVSRSATEHGVAVLWSVCYLSRDRTAQEAAMRSNGLAKVLVAMQSNCSGSVRQMCGDLVKVLRVNAKSCLAGYETKTTHIMPY